MAEARRDARGHDRSCDYQQHHHRASASVALGWCFDLRDAESKLNQARASLDAVPLPFDQQEGSSARASVVRDVEGGIAIA